MATLTAGVTAPAFELVDQNSATVTLDDFRGRKLLIYFYPKADTPGCTIQSCAVSEALPDLVSSGCCPAKL